MEQDTGFVVPVPTNQYIELQDDPRRVPFPNDAFRGYFYGRVMYTHGPGIDAPLTMARMEYSDSLHRAYTVVPRSDWRGSYDMGTWRFSGIRPPCVKVKVTYRLDEQPWEPGQDTATTSYTDHCINVEWPAPHVSITHSRSSSNLEGTLGWNGSLIDGMRDLSGVLYRRNRYYDPNTGRFTQEDPIGLAGGLNLYGFANGDPVSYSDPYGLAVCTKSPALQRGLSRAVNATVRWGTDGCIRNLSQITYHGGSEWSPIRAVFNQLVDHDSEFWLDQHPESACRRRGCSGYEGGGRWGIYDSDWDRIDNLDGNQFKTGYRYEQCGRRWGESKATMALGALIIHELLWHGQGSFGLGIRVATPDGRRAQSYELENIYNRAYGRPPRCAD